MVFQQKPLKKSRFHLLTDWSGTRPAMVRPASFGKSGWQMELERPKNSRVFLLITLRFLEVRMFTFFSPFWTLFIDKDSLSFWSQKWWRKVVLCIRKSHVFRATSSPVRKRVTSDYPGVSREKCEKTPSKLEKPKMTEQIISPGFEAFERNCRWVFLTVFLFNSFFPWSFQKLNIYCFVLAVVFEIFISHFSHVFRLG